MLHKKVHTWLIVFVFLVVFMVGSFPSFAAQEQEIILLHTNDTHARVITKMDDETNTIKGIGFDLISGLKQQLMQDGNNVLLVDAGDTLHGQSIATLSKGESIVELMNLTGYDAMAPGNHDFNYGYTRLKELEGKMNFPLLASNVTDKDENLVFKEPWIKEVDGIKLGFFGLATPETAYKTNPKNVKDIIFQDPTEYAKQAVNQLQEEGADVIIALAHIGLEGQYTSTAIAKAIPSIDVVIDGHSHSKLENGLLEGNTLIASRGEHDKAIGKVVLHFEDHQLTDKKASLLLPEDFTDIAPDSKVTAAVEQIQKDQEKILSQAIGSTDVDLVGEREIVRTGESNLGQLLTDAMLDATGAEIAITNGGGIRATIPAGTITKDHVLTAFPFGNYLVTKNVTGSDIKAALEHGVSDYPEAKGAFPHVAGITFTLDPSKPVGGRISNLQVGDQTMVMDQAYVLVTNDFMAVGGDDYTMLKEAPLVNEYSAMDEILHQYIKEKSPISGKLEKRIYFSNEPSIAEEESQPSSAETNETVNEEPDQPVTNVDDTEEATSENNTEEAVNSDPVMPEPDSTEPTVAPISDENLSLSDDTSSSTPSYYIVVSGDVLWKIAKKYDTTYQELAKINQLSNPHLIFPGQKLLLP